MLNHLPELSCSISAFIFNELPCLLGNANMIGIVAFASVLVARFALRPLSGLAGAACGTLPCVEDEW